MSPVEQATNYASIKKETKYAIVSNYDEFRLFNPSHRQDYISFNFKELKDPKILKYFLLIFSKYSLIQNDIVDILVEKQPITINTVLENEFYKLYSETRLMLIKQLNHPVKEDDFCFSLDDSIYYAQLILNI